LGFAMMSVETLADALVIAKRYLAAGPSLIDLDFEHDPNKNEFSFRANTINAKNNMLPFIMEELSSSIISVFSLMLNQPFKLNKVELSYNRPSYGHLYDRYLACPIEYNCASNKLTFDAKYLDYKMAASNPISAGLAEHLCSQSIEKQLQKGDIGSDIKRILIRTPGVFPTMELVAEELGMSPRSLRRKLTELDSSFQAIFDEVRMKMAIQYLQNSDTSLDEVSEFIGFSDYNNFRKAFKRWTGHPPSYYRS
jgi:AraC-like DNA-binding protein